MHAHRWLRVGITLLVISQLVISLIAPVRVAAAEARSAGQAVSNDTATAVAGEQPGVEGGQIEDTTLSVVILSSPWVTLDSNDPQGLNGPTPKVFVVEGRVTNIGASPATNVVLSLDYNEDPANNWVLLPGEDPERTIDSLAPGEEYYAFWFASYSLAPNSVHQYSVAAYADNAPLVSTSDNFYGNPQPGYTVKTRTALSTGNSGVTQVALDITVGVEFTVTVSYDLGTNPLNVLFSPVGNPTFNPGAYRMLASTVRFYNDAGTWQTTVPNRLYIPTLDARAQNAQVVFIFIALMLENTSICPYGVVGYSTREKYDNNYCDALLGTEIPIEGTLDFAIDKQADATVEQGEILTYQIYYTNTGTLPIMYAWVWDEIDLSLSSIITSSIAPPPDPIETNTSRVAWYLNQVPASGQPGSSGMLSFSVLVDGGGQDIPSGTPVVNTAHFGITPDSLPNTSALTDTVSTIVLAPTITVYKTDGVTTAEPGDPLTYTLQIDNPGTVTANGVVITDVLPAEVSLAGAPTPAPDVQYGQTLVWTNLGPIPPNGNVTIRIPVTVNMKTADATVLTNNMSVGYGNPAGHNYNIKTAFDTTTVNAPVLTISKSDYPDPVLIGQPLLYTLSYANTGHGEATNVVITDTVPLSTTYQSCGGATCNISGNVVTWNLGMIPAQASGSVSFTVLVDELLPSGSLIRNNNYAIVSDQTNFLAGASVTTLVLREAAQFTGHAYVDANANGVFDGGESTIAGVDVTLPQATEPVTTTDSNGEYHFRVEVQGPVSISAALPVGYFRTTPGTVFIDSQLGITQTVNFGYAPTGSPFGVIYGVVFKDDNYDGVQSLGETGLEGASVSSAQANNSPRITNALGQYTLSFSASQAVTIVEANLPGYVSTTPDLVNANAVLGSSSDSPIDFGDFLGIEVSGQVFNDVNVNGMNDPGESGLAGAVVSANGETTTSMGSGLYTLYLAISGGAPIDILETDLSGYVSTNAVPGNGMSRIDANTLRIIAPASGTIYSGGDFGDVMASAVITITGQVWNDDGSGGGGLANGQRDGAEPGMAGAIVTLSSGASQTIAVDGAYVLFAPSGQVVTITESNLAGYISTNAIAGSNANKVDNDTLVVDALGGGSISSDNLFGDVLMTNAAIITGTVYDDQNENGVRDAGEIGLAGVEISLEIEAGNTITLTTATNGSYQFAVAPGTYMRISSAGPGGSYRPTTPESLVLFPSTAGVYPNNNFGYSNALDVAVIYGIVFDDINSNGIQDFGEPGLVDAVIWLNNTISVTTTSNGLIVGTFEFTVQSAGIYNLRETNPTGYRSTTPDVINVEVTLGYSYGVEFGDTNNSETASVYGLVFDDLDGDGIQGVNEQGLPGVVISMTLGGSQDVMTTTTRAYGYFNYGFDINEQGYHMVYEQDPARTGYHSTTPDAVSIFIELGNSYIVNFGDSLGSFSSVVGVVFNDLNADGEQDLGEGGIPGVTVTLSNGMSMTTGQYGIYAFAVNVPGDIEVVETDLPGYHSTTPNTVALSISPGLVYVVNFGDSDNPFESSLFGTVFDDQNVNGIRDAGEPPLSGITVTMSNDTSYSVLTNGSGQYTFRVEFSGTYTVTETDEPGWVSTNAIPGSPAVTKVNDNVLRATIDELGIDLGDNMFGDVPSAQVVTITGTVWNDNGAGAGGVGGDGLRNGAEPGLAGVSVSLSSGLSQLTGLDGSFTLYAPPDQVITITETNPAMYVSTGAEAGTNAYLVDIDHIGVVGTLPGGSSSTGNSFGDVMGAYGLVLTKQAEDVDGPPLVVSDTIRYTLGVSNTSAYTVYQVAVTDDLPDGVSFVDMQATMGTTSGPDPVNWSIPTLQPAAEATLWITVTINTDQAGQSITNTGTITATNLITPPIQPPAVCPDGSLPINGNCPNTPQGSADLSITKTASAYQVYAGDWLTYTMVIDNPGPSNAENVSASDTLPAGVALYSYEVSQGTFEPGTGVWSVGSVEVNASATLTLVVLVNPDATGMIENTVEVSSDTYDPDISNNTDAVQTLVNGQADLVINKDGEPDPVIAGTTLTYTLDLANYGPSEAQGVAITDTLPVQVSFGGVVSQTGFLTGPTQNGQTLTWTADLLAAGEAGTIVFTVTVGADVPDGTEIENVAEIGSQTVDLNLYNNTIFVDTLVLAVADLAISKSDMPDPVAAGGTLTYTLSFANQGPSFAEALVITDELPIEVTFGSIISQPAYLSGPVQTGRLLTWTATELPAGETGAIVFSVAVHPETSGMIENLAVISSITQDPAVGNNLDSEPTTVGTTDQATIYGWVFEDTNGNGLKDPGENGIPGVVITMDGSETTATDADGMYYFITGVAGMHVIVETDPTGYFSTTPNEVHLWVNLGNSYRVDFGDALDSSGFAAIFGTVFDDLNQDGVWDAAEIGIPGVVLTLDGGATTTSDAYGSYSLRLDTAGNHLVVETDPAGYVSTTPNEVQVSVQLGHGYEVDYGDVAECTCPPDSFEEDDTQAEAAPIEVGLPGLQERTFCDDATDWITFTAQAEGVYTITTDSYGQRADTFLALYDTDGETLLAANDDYQGASDHSSQIIWQAPVSGIYYIHVTNRAGLTCCQTNYRVWVGAEVSTTPLIFLPVIYRNAQNGPSGFEDLPAASPDGVIGHMCPDTFEVDDAWEQAQAILPGVLQIHSFDSNPALYAADKDVVSFDVRANDLVTFTIVTITNTQTLLELFDANGNSLGITGTTQLVWQATEAGHYYLSISPEVQTFGCSNTVGYQLLMERSIQPRFFLPMISK